MLSSPGTGPLLTEGTTSAGEWIGITTNSEECSYSSEIEESDSQHECNVRDNIELNDHPFAWEFELVIVLYYRITQAPQLCSKHQGIWNATKSIVKILFMHPFNETALSFHIFYPFFK